MINRKTSSSRRTFLLGCLSVVAAPLLPFSSFAESPPWPTQPVKIVIGSGPGTVSDTIARLYAPRLSEIWKQPVIVENKIGAGGIVGTEYTLAANDGHTLLMATPSMLLAKYSTPNLRFDPLTDLTPVYRVVDIPVMLITNAKTAQRANTLAEFVEFTKSTPEGIFFSGLGRAAFFDTSMAVLAKSMGLRHSVINFNGVGPLSVALLRDDTQLAILPPLSVEGQINSKEIHPLAVIDSKRLAAFPDVPTLGEAVDYKGFLPISWAGVFAPKATPAEVVDIISRSLDTLYADESARNSLETRLSATLRQSSPEQFAREYAAEAKVWENTLEMQDVASK